MKKPVFIVVLGLLCAGGQVEAAYRSVEEMLRESGRTEQPPGSVQELMQQSMEQQMLPQRRQPQQQEVKFYTKRIEDMRITQIVAKVQQANECGYNSFVYTRAMADAWDRQGKRLNKNMVSQFALRGADWAIEGNVESVIKKFPNIDKGKDIGMSQLQFLMDIDGGGDPKFSVEVSKTGIYQTIWDEDYFENFLGRQIKAKDKIVKAAVTRFKKGSPAETFIVKGKGTGHWIAVMLVPPRNLGDRNAVWDIYFIDSIAGKRNAINEHKHVFYRMLHKEKQI